MRYKNDFLFRKMILNSKKFRIFVLDKIYMKVTKNIVITGGNSGIGYETVRGLYKDGHNVIFGSRNVQKNEEAVQEITKQAGGTVKSVSLDLSKRESVENFAKEILGAFPHIDILINNAGIILSEKAISELGIQMTYTINYFGHFYLTYLLFESIKKAQEGRIINVSSLVHFYAKDNLLEDMAYENKWGNIDAYFNSKMFNVLFTVGLNNYLKEKNIQNIKTACLHPGIVNTNMGTDFCLGKLVRYFCCCIFVNNQSGAKTSLHLSRIPFEEIKSGSYYNDDNSLKEMDKRGTDMDNVRKLWEISEKAYKIKFD